MDSSAWFDIDRLRNSDIAWRIVVALIDADRLFSPREVCNELISLSDRIEPHRRKLESRSRADEEFYLLAGKIALEHPSMAKIYSRKNPADPWLIALARLESLVVVCSESRRARNKIPRVCRKFGVRCVTLTELIAAERHLIASGAAKGPDDRPSDSATRH
jgi:hypothetical protein